MSSISQYRIATRREVELSGGVKVTVRQLCVSDMLNVGDIPTAFLTKGKATAEDVQHVAKTDPKFIANILRVALLNCVVGPDDFRVVDKPPRDCAENEISLEEISPADATAVLNAVVSISALTRDAVATARPFRPEQAPVGATA